VWGEVTWGAVWNLDQGGDLGQITTAEDTAVVGLGVTHQDNRLAGFTGNVGRHFTDIELSKYPPWETGIAYLREAP
jgi:hypothetical protein